MAVFHGGSSTFLVFLPLCTSSVSIQDIPLCIFNVCIPEIPLCGPNTFCHNILLTSTAIYSQSAENKEEFFLNFYQRIQISGKR